uniref:F-box protein At5g07610-like n=1 Tax=Erigeron canadensis TaxID=72917 RepID=UPI001CB9076F|nr:F-box protein At5g07610-like [Erigeron canadensis]
MMNTRSKVRKTQDPLKYLYKQVSRFEYNQESTDSGALIGSNDDIITEILLRLPAKSILRFKCVSKHWLSLLSHQCFTLRYDKVLKSPGLFYDSSYIPFDDGEDRTTPPCSGLVDHNIQVVQSCNGLLLCRGNPGDEYAFVYSVLNPTTKQFTIIPPIHGRRKDRRLICFMGLAYHITDCVHFKVVCIRYAKVFEDLLQVQIYSSDTGKWKILNESFSVPHYTFLRSGVYWKGAFHWIPSCLDPMYLNLKTNKLQKLPLPCPLPVRVEPFGGYCDGIVPFYFGESGGHLHLVAGSHLEYHLHLNVYEMLSDHSGWYIKYQVELDELPTLYPEVIDYSRHPSHPNYYTLRMIDLVRGEEEEDTFMVLRIPNKIISYNVINKSFKLILHFPDVPDNRVSYAEVHRYIKTLSLF